MIQNTILHKASLFLQSIQLYSARHNKKQDIMHIQRQCKQDRQGTYKCNIEVHSRDHCCCEKAVSTTYSECMCLHSCLSYPACKKYLPIILPSVACQALPYFSKVSHKWHDFQKNVIEYKMSVSFSTTFETFLILRRIRQDSIINVRRSSCKVPIILVWF
jgi:hypothetical protein